MLQFWNLRSNIRATSAVPLRSTFKGESNVSQANCKGFPLLQKLSRIGFALIVAVVHGCGGDKPQSTLDPKGPIAQMQLDLFVLTLWVCLGAFIVVGGAMFIALVKFRARKEGDEPPAGLPTHSSALEWGFLAITAGLLILIEIPNVKLLYQMYDAPEGSNPLTVNVIGHQWWWEFEYPEYGFKTANEWHIPKGRAVEIHLSTADVIHSFWAPQFAGKLDTMPNQDNKMWLQADELGVFPGQCAELCGDSHAVMRFITVVDTPADFEAWVEKQKAKAQPFRHGFNQELVDEGAQLFMTKTCMACHTIRGANAFGVLGPDLTHFGSRLTVADGILDNNAENIKKWIADPEKIKPGSLMPKLDLNERELDAVAAYMISLK